MISNERPSPFQPRRPKFPQHQFPPRPPVDERTLSVQQKVAAGGRVGRNDPCPCGSGKKYKQCHGKLA